MEFAIRVDLAPLLDALQKDVQVVVLPRLQQAVMAVANQAREDWEDQIKSAKLWSGEKKNYVATLKLEATGAYSALVSSDYRHAEAIETGRPAFDLKYMLATSAKTRLSKTGKRYLIIPFQHNIKTMPAAVYRAAKALPPSQVIGKTTRISATGATVPQLIYAWGGRLKAGSVPEMQRRHAGMVRFDQSAGGKGAPRSGYMTFRVMSEDSSGWVIPAQAGQHLVKKVVDRLRPLAEKAFAEAIART